MKKEEMKNIFYRLIFCFLVIVLIFLLIITLYSILDIIITRDPSWISFWGSILGGILTLFGVWWTLNEQRKQFEKSLIEQQRMYNTTIKPNVCLSIVYTAEGTSYLRAKNFGNSNAKILKFSVNFEIPEQKDAFPTFPLVKIENYILSPQQFIAGEIDKKFLKPHNKVKVYYQDELGSRYTNEINLGSSYSNAFYNGEDFDYLK